MKRLVVIGVRLDVGRAALAACGGSSGNAGSSITVSDAWVRNPPIADQPGAAYLVIQNNGAAEDKLLSVESDVAKTIELHESMEIERHDADVACPEHSGSGQRQSGVEARRSPRDVDRPDASIEDGGQGAVDVEL